jgi:hypothetical protein
LKKDVKGLAKLLQVDIWMTKEDTFPHFGGRVDVKGLDFRIMDAPSSFKVPAM